MIIGVPKETKLQEHRIGLTPDSVKVLTSKGHKVLIQENGGFEAGFTNENYKNAGSEIITNPSEIFNNAEIIVKVKEPQIEEVKMIKENQIIFTYLHLAAAKELTHLPVVTDPSHATFWNPWVKPMALASVAAGADGIMLEVHPDPKNSAVDPLQPINFTSFSELMLRMDKVARIVGKQILDV